MNPVDHPHTGDEGRTQDERPSVSPWGKLTKGGFKTSRSKKRIAYLSKRYSSRKSFMNVYVHRTFTNRHRLVPPPQQRLGGPEARLWLAAPTTIR